MRELMRKTILLGWGLAVLTAEKVEEAVQEIVKKGEFSEREGKELVQELVERSKRAKKDLGERVEKIVAETLRKLNLPAREDLEGLRARIEQLEKMLDKRA